MLQWLYIQSHPSLSTFSTPAAAKFSSTPATCSGLEDPSRNWSAPATSTPTEYRRLLNMDDQKSLCFQIPVIQFYQHDPSMLGSRPSSKAWFRCAEIRYWWPGEPPIDMRWPWNSMRPPCYSNPIKHIFISSVDTLHTREEDAVAPVCELPSDVCWQ